MCYTTGMKITPKIMEEFKRIMWDYHVDAKTLVNVAQGKISTFSLNQSKLFARLLVSTSWYRLLDCFGVQGLKEMLKDDVIAQIWKKDVQEKFLYAKEMLNGSS